MKQTKQMYLVQGKQFSKTSELVNILPIVTTSWNVIHYFVAHAHSVKVTRVPVINKAPKPNNK